MGGEGECCSDIPDEQDQEADLDCIRDMATMELSQRES